MPVIDCFDPDTGASGGPTPCPGGGTSLADLTPTLIDLTNGWTLFDPDSLIDSVTHSAGWNTVTWNAAAANAAYNWSTASGGMSAPRWYKSLILTGTDPVTSTDTLLFTTEMEASRTDDFLSKVILTAAEAVTSTDPALIRAVGGAINKVSTTQISGGAYAFSAETVAQSAILGATLNTTLRSHDSMGGSLYVALNDSSPATGVSMGSRISNRSNAGAAGAGVPLSVMVGVGPKTSAISIGAGDTQRFRLSFVAATIGFGA